MLNKSEVKYIQSLKDKKSRDEHGVFVAEGPRIMADLLNDCPADIVSVYALESWMASQPGLPSGIQCHIVADFELEKLSFMQTPQQVLAVVKKPSAGFVPFTKGEWHLLLDGIQDPGNLGTIIRTADWFGIKALYCTDDCADCFNPKVVQASMGSVPRIPVYYGDAAGWLASAGIPVYGTLLNGSSIFSGPFEPGVIVIGSEGKGIRPAIEKLITQGITIPGRGKAESLNAAVAAGVVLAELVR